MKRFQHLLQKGLFLILPIVFFLFSFQPLAAQELDPRPQNDPLKSLRSDVGIVGLSTNLDWWNSFNYLEADSALVYGSNHEIEIVFRDIRMISPHVGVGFQVLGSFFISDSGFGLGGWGVGPVIRAYPFETDRFLPYIQTQALFGNNLGLGELSDTVNEANGFRVRLGLQAGVGIRVTNNFGFFVEFGPMWESSRIFNANAFVWQLNIGIDLYRFKR